VESLLDIAIVPAGPGDADDLGQLHVKSWRETYGGLLPQAYLSRMRAQDHARRFARQLLVPRQGETVLIAEGSAGPVGYASGAVLRGDERRADAELFTLYVLRAAQGVGVGRALLGASARVLRAQGARSLMLFVLSPNRAARRFYEHLGGEAFAEVPSRGWGRNLTETAYRWTDIGVLAGGTAYLG
jgi:ribosomal protein S18 acetylase RimI-like enzyme